jgi:cysteine-S-conjugate beta-lyase
MATFDFDHAPERLGTRCVKWDSIGEGELPMWVADMDFEVAPAIRQAVERRAAHPVYGYTFTDESYYDAVINWFDRRHQWHIDRSWILHTPGVVAAMSCAIKALTLPGQQVVILTPVYNCFFSSIRNCGCVASECELKREGDSYVIDYDDLERRCADERAAVLLFCNPHNPAGRVWRRDELERVSDICRRHHVRVIADEIHCELVMRAWCISTL